MVEPATTTNRRLGSLKKRTGLELCLESGKLGIGLTLLVVIILVNHNTYSLVKCLAAQMENLTKLPPGVQVIGEEEDECIEKVGEAVTFHLCYENASSSTLYVYAWHRRLIVLLETPQLENIAEWLTNCANGHCSRLADPECPFLSKTSFGGTAVEVCSYEDGSMLYASIGGFSFSTSDSRMLIALLR